MPMPGYQFSTVRGIARIEELYDETQTQSSTPNSESSTPFGSPSMSVGTGQTFGFQDIHVGPPGPLNPFSSAMTTVAQYRSVTVTSNPMQDFFHNPETVEYPDSDSPSK